MKYSIFPLAVIATAIIGAYPASATVNSLSSLPSYFSWAYFGGALAIAQIHGVNFITPPGSAGAIQTVSAPVYSAVVMAIQKCCATAPFDANRSAMCSSSMPSGREPSDTDW